MAGGRRGRRRGRGQMEFSSPLWLLRRLRQFLSFSKLVVSSAGAAGSAFSGMPGSGLGALLSGDWGQLSMREASSPFWYSCRVICAGTPAGNRVGQPKVWASASQNYVGAPKGMEFPAQNGTRDPTCQDFHSKKV